MKITTKFFKKKLPDMTAGEVVFRTVSADQQLCRMFIREVDDSAYPSRVCVEMTRNEAQALLNAMLSEFGFLTTD